MIVCGLILLSRSRVLWGSPHPPPKYRYSQWFGLSLPMALLEILSERQVLLFRKDKYVQYSIKCLLAWLYGSFSEVISTVRNDKGYP